MCENLKKSSSTLSRKAGKNCHISSRFSHCVKPNLEEFLFQFSTVICHFLECNLYTALLSTTCCKTVSPLYHKLVFAYWPTVVSNFVKVTRYDTPLTDRQLSDRSEEGEVGSSTSTDFENP